MRKSCSNLDREIESCKPTSSTDPTCHFHNGSWVRVVAATDGARSKRANILIVDEFRMVKKEVVDKVLRRRRKLAQSKLCEPLRKRGCVLCNNMLTVKALKC